LNKSNDGDIMEIGKKKLTATEIRLLARGEYQILGAAYELHLNMEFPDLEDHLTMEEMDAIADLIYKRLGEWILPESEFDLHIHRLCDEVLYRYNSIMTKNKRS